MTSPDGTLDQAPSPPAEALHDRTETSQRSFACPFNKCNSFAFGTSEPVCRDCSTWQGAKATDLKQPLLRDHVSQNVSHGSEHTRSMSTTYTTAAMASLKSRQQPQAPPLLTGTPESGVKDKKEMLAQCKKVLDGIIAKTSSQDASFRNLVLLIAQCVNSQASSTPVSGLYQYMLSDQTLRDASAQAEKLMDKHGMETSMREEVHRPVATALMRGDNVDAEIPRWLEKDYKGYVLSPEIRGLNDLLSEKTSYVPVGGVPSLITYDKSQSVRSHLEDKASGWVSSSPSPLPKDRIQNFPCVHPGCTRKFVNQAELRNHIEVRHPIDGHIFGKFEYLPDYWQRMRLLNRLLLKSQKAAGATRNFLPILADGKALDALPDSGSCANVITEEYAISRKLKIDRQPIKCRRFKNAIGMNFESIGEVSLLLSFHGDVETRFIEEKFAVVKKCAAPMVLGRTFLEKHEIYTRFRHLLKKVALTAKKMWRLMYMDVPYQKFTCRVDGESIPVSIDTGSEKNFMSCAYTRRRGWKVNPMPEDEGFVKLADTTVVKVTGFVDKTITIGRKDHWERFYVLRGLMSDALLGDETIDRIDFYNETEKNGMSHLWTDSDEFNEFCAISWIDRIEDHTSRFLDDPTYQMPDRDMQELLTEIQLPSNTLNLSPSKTRRRWWQSQSKRQKGIDQQYQILQSGIWTKLEKLDNSESEARREAKEAMVGVSDDEKCTMQDADASRRQKHEDERAHLLDLRTKLLEWNKNRNK